MEEGHERRNVNGKQRKSRVAAGGVSAPVAIILTWTITEHWGTQMSDEVIIALATLVGSAVTAITVCFYDLRGMLLSRLYHRRQADESEAD